MAGANTFDSGCVLVFNMDRAALEQQLAEAERHVVNGERIVTQQRQLIAELERYKFDSSVARDLLMTLEKTQASHIADRNRLRTELGLDNSAK